jgi:hypothetical protein
VSDGTASRGERGPRVTLRALGPTPARGAGPQTSARARAPRKQHHTPTRSKSWAIHGVRSALTFKALHELDDIGARICGPLLELAPHGIAFRAHKSVRVEISVPEGDEEKDVVLLHRDIPVSEFEKDTNTWEVISNICWPIGPGRVAVDVNAFCFMILSFPFSGMDSLRKIKFGGEDIPSWRQSCRGMMIDVQCANEKCNAHKERVLVKLGFSRFDYTTDWGGHDQVPAVRIPVPTRSERHCAILRLQLEV